MAKVYLSRRNLLTLLSKLDRVKAGQISQCTVVKRDYMHLRYPQSMKLISVVAVENADAYSSRPKCQLNLSRQNIIELCRQLDSGQFASAQVSNLSVFGLEDADYYTDRPAGFVLPVDDPTPPPMLH